jgi:polyphosphate kinase
LPHTALFRAAGPVNLVRLSQLIDLVADPSLSFPNHQSSFPKQLSQNSSIFSRIQQGDVLIHQPFESFDGVLSFLKEAVEDPNVLAIKQTIYRTGSDPAMMNLLREAVRRGKEVTAVVELKARFDEEANLVWKRILEEEGVKVLVGFPDMKVHAKICSIAKRVNKKLKYYGFVSTGNLNENTARFYGDHCLLTANLKILSDVNRVFNFIEKPNDFSELHKCKYLITSPINTREYFIQKIRNEIKQTNKKHQGSIILKLNSLADDKLIEELYKAAEIGVDIKLIVRGICRVITTNNKWVQNINAISIVDEYLEHARILFFENKGVDDLYISSADWMVRNIDHRVEVTTPIFNKYIKQELKDILAIQLVENEKARILDNKQQNHYVTRTLNEKWIRSQVEIYNYLQSKKY